MKELQKHILTDLLLEAKTHLAEVCEVIKDFHSKNHIFTKMVVTYRDGNSGTVMVLLSKDGSVIQRASHLDCSEVYAFDDVSNEATHAIEQLATEPEDHIEPRAFEFKTFMYALKDIRTRRVKSLQTMVHNAGYRGTPEKMRCQ